MSGRLGLTGFKKAGAQSLKSFFLIDNMCILICRLLDFEVLIVFYSSTHVL